MFQNIFKIAVRILFRNKIYSAINLLGLTIGIACSLLILILVWDHITYDRFHENAKRIFLVQQTMDLGTGEYTTDRSGGAYAQALKDGFPEVINTTRLSTTGELLLSYYPINKDSSKDGNDADVKKFIEDLVMAADSSFFEIFSFPLLKGDPKSALKEPYSIVLTKEMAEKYFGNDDPMNKIIRINQGFDFKVTGVADKYPDNSTIRFDFLVPFPFLDELGWDISNYEGNPFHTFLLLNNPDNYKNISEKLPAFFSGLFDNDIKAVQKLLPFLKMNLFGESRSFWAVLMLSILAFLILMIACINFMNLSTARFLTRTREVGIRKVVGASRGKLIAQFIGETMIMSFISINIAILAVDIILPSFNKLLEAKLVLDLKDPAFFMLLIILLLFTGFIAGSYPAFFLSSFKPVDVLKKTIIPGSRGGFLRKTLVVIQFVFSIIFIISTVVIFKQFNFMQTSNLGVNRENIIYLPVRGELASNYNYMKQELLANPDILSVTTSSKIPVFVDRGEVKWGLNSEDNNDLARILSVGYDFQKTFDINLKEGRFYSPEFAADSIDKIIVDESVIKKLGLDSPLGKIIYFLEKPYTIIGVTDNFISFPLKLGGENLILPFQKVGDFIFIKTEQTRLPATLSYIEGIYEKFNPDYPFITFYMDDYLDPISDMMNKSSKLIMYFTFFGIFISCLGLFGLSTFAAEQKTREIAIRKAMGASIRRILLLVNTEFLKLVCIAFIIALPLSIFLINIMFKNFSRRIEVESGIFIYTGLLIVIISFLTIFYQALRSATRNPADSLRYE
jgi:ABC-type antimicrobial peptide transport system permease subunit